MRKAGRADVFSTLLWCGAEGRSKMVVMRSTSSAIGTWLSALGLGLLGLVTSGCVGTAGNASGSGRVVVAVDGQQSTSTQTFETTEIVPPVATEQPPARRRLSQTVTLGEQTNDPSYRGAPGAPGAPGAGNSQNVTVNNNVTIVQQPPIVYGGYGGFGGYGGSNAYGAGNGRDGFGRTSNTRGAWAPNGWEGAGRTAAPGHTPGVGGNWSPAPSHGPAPMR